MNNKEFIIEHLCSMGFELTDAESFGYVFSYDDLSYLYMPDDDDENFLRFALPNIYDVTEENRNDVLEAIQDVSQLLKYSKTCIMFGNTVWITYEHYLNSTENIEELIEHILDVLRATATVFQKKINGEDIMPKTDDADAELDKAIENLKD